MMIHPQCWPRPPPAKSGPAAKGEGIDMDKTLPTEWFYCSDSDWLIVTGEPELSPATADYISSTEPHNMTAMSAVHADDGAMPRGCGDDSPTSPMSCNVTVGILLSLLLLCIAIILFYCCCQTLSKCRRETQPTNGDVIRERENEKFVCTNI